MIEEVFGNRPPSGEYRDVLLGPRGLIIWEHPWRSNLIVAGLSGLLAEMFKGDREGVRIAWWAVGTGDQVWDNGTVPEESARRSWAALQNEAGRRAIPADDIRYVEGALNRLEIEVAFTTEDIPPGEGNENRQLREFGLFVGGDENQNSGVMINHRIHPRIDMQTGFTLQRTLRFTF